MIEARLALALVALAPGALAAPQSVYPTGVTIYSPDATNDGYTLFVGRSGGPRLIDMEGTTVNVWTSPDPSAALATLQPLEDGHILAYLLDVQSLTGSLRARSIVELDYDSNVVWRWWFPPTAHKKAIFTHDNERLANGNTLVLAMEPTASFSSARLPGTPIGGPAPASWTYDPEPFRDDYILELDPWGQVVWRWNTKDHFEELGFSPEQIEEIESMKGAWAHTNSIAVIPPNDHVDPAFAEGNIIVSQRYTNTIFIIDKSTGSVVWQTGPGEDHLTFGQHYPHMIPRGLPGAGNILVFDNGSGTGYDEKRFAPGQSTVVEFDPVTMEVVWTYKEGKRFWSDIASGAQRLENGNTLICSAVKGRIFEVDVDGNIVWEYMSPYTVPQGLGKSALVYRAYRLSYDWVPSAAGR